MHPARPRRPWPSLLVAAIALGSLVACQPTTPTPTTTTTTTRPQVVGPGPGDGKAVERAGVSCWGIKQQYPSSATGTYWLATPAMDRPAQFHCDMTTAGGGWVLIGRGREGWTFQPTGQGSAAQVRSPVSGASAFAPAALDSATITGLINGATVSNLSEGVRLERMTNTAGTTKQDYRIYLKQAKWNWTFHAGQLLSKVVIDGKAFTGSNTRDTLASVPGQTTNALAGQQGLRRMFTWAWDRNDNKQGFSYGNGGPRGTVSGTNNLWQRSTTSYTIPFTRVWLRPKLANTIAFPATPAGGFPAAPKKAGLKDRSEVAPWGVVGNDHTNEQLVEPWNTNVLAVEAWGSRVFVGGRFTGVKQGPTGATTAQRSLAAFDLDGSWIPTFRPTVTGGRVWDLTMAPDGSLIVAGDFESINGAPGTRGLAKLDPTTGAVIAGWKARVSRVAGKEWRVRTVEVRGSTVYVGGLFDRVVAGTSTVPVAVTNAMGVSLADGTLGAWQPKPNGSLIDLDVTDDGTRVLLAGNFSSVNGNATHGYFGIVSSTTGAPVAGTGAWTPPVGTTTANRYQQATADLGDRLAVGGAEHVVQLWNKARTSRLDAAILQPGGDVQVIDRFGATTYVGCHCGGWAYLGTNDFASPKGFRAIEPINLVGAWDAATWTYDTSWYAGSLKGAYGEGVWDLDLDQRGCLWVGGDLVRGAYSGNAATDYLGGFARFCGLDTTVPSAPSSVTLTSTGTSRKLTWTASTDPDGTAPSYDVVRNGRVIATLNSATRTYTDPSAPAGTTYTVRATDARGNRSATTAPRIAG